MSSFLLLILTFIALGLIGMVRNLLVFQYRSGILNAIHHLNLEEIGKGAKSDYAERYQTFDSVSYNRMVFMFWRRLNSFYPQRFLKEIGVK